MTRAARRASLLVALYLLTSAATASAECAWVLWVTSKVESGIATSPFDLFQSLQDCRKVMFGKPMQVIVENAKKEGATLAPVCLPDTVDPRGPKGK